ncbi:MAG: hypothetical protein WA957_16865 [Alteraurantiacibacter sp.]
MLKYYEDALAGIDKRIADGFAVRHHQSLRPHDAMRVAEERQKQAARQEAAP